MYFCPGWQNIFFLGYKKIFFDIYFLFFRLWCSTGVDEDGQHIVNGQNWAHCSDSCPVSDTEVTPVSSAFSIVSSIHQSLWWILWHNITQSLNIFSGETTTLQNHSWSGWNLQTSLTMYRSNNPVPGGQWVFPGQWWTRHVLCSSSCGQYHQHHWWSSGR